MKIKWGALVVDGRGKIGGQVASKNRSGSYMRNKVTPVNPQTSFQQTARQQLGALSSQWSSLTQAQRDAWNNAVAAYASTNIFGDSVQPTGKNLFVGLNRNLANAGQAAIDTPLAPAELPTISLDTFLNGSTDGGVTTNLSVDLASEGDAGNVTFLFRVTPPLSPGKSFIKNDLRLLTIGDGGEIAAAYNIKAAFEARFGEQVTGQRIAVQVVAINNSTGQMGVPITFSSITTVTG